jgi:uncharacterized protein (DUF488 family)
MCDRQAMTIWTIGHSTDAIETFVATLRAQAIALLVDVRRFPGSRRHPQFTKDALAIALPAAAIDYLHLPELGGRRQPLKDSPNTAWRLEAFRGYADYMDTPAFAAGIDRLLQVAAGRRAAIMCAERVWWSCHRALIADLLKSHGHDVRHIMGSGRVEPHPYTSAARLVDGQLSYRGLF